MKIFSGTSNTPFAQALASACQLPLGRREIARFGDGEIRLRLEEPVAGERIFCVQSFAPDVNGNLIEALLFLDALSKDGAKEIIAVFPYLAYARQNKEHRVGESISAKTIAKLFTSCGVSKVFTYDIHALNALTFFSCPTVNIPVLPWLLSRFLQDINPNKQDLVLIAPDQDGAKRVKEAASSHGLMHGFVQKERDLEAIDVIKETHGQRIAGEVSGKIVVLADDMIATGSTLLQAARYVKEAGANEVYALATHGIFTKGIDHLLSGELKHIYISDSILQKNLPEKISIVPTVQNLASILLEMPTAAHG